MRMLVMIVAQTSSVAVWIDVHVLVLDGVLFQNIADDKRTVARGSHILPARVSLR